MWPELSQRLEGRLVALEPLRAEHEARLRAAAADDAIWRWMQIDGSTRDGFDRWFAHALREASLGTEAPFVTIDSSRRDVLGSTRFMCLRPEHRGVEIGNTWLVGSAWGGGGNIEAKLLMLEHAFERCGCIRAEFKTDARNERSRAALAALPARFEGLFRKHMLVQGGRVRDSAYYAIVDEDWPEVRASLERRLEAKLRAR